MLLQVVLLLVWPALIFVSYLLCSRAVKGFDRRYPNADED